MTKYWSKDAVFTIDDSGTVIRDISAHVTGVDGLPSGVESLDVTGFGDTGARRFAGIQNVSFTVEGNYDDTALTGSDTVLSGIIGLIGSFSYSPDGTRVFTGEALLRSYTVRAGVPGQATFRAEFDVDGVVGVA